MEQENHGERPSFNLEEIDKDILEFQEVLTEASDEIISLKEDLETKKAMLAAYYSFFEGRDKPGWEPPSWLTEEEALELIHEMHDLTDEILDYKEITVKSKYLMERHRLLSEKILNKIMRPTEEDNPDDSGHIRTEWWVRFNSI